MRYEVSVKDKNTGEVYHEAIEAENRPSAVQKAMRELHKKVPPPTHFVAEKIRLNNEGA